MKKLIVSLSYTPAILFLMNTVAIAAEGAEGKGSVSFFVAVVIAAGIGMGIGSFGTAIAQGNAIRGAVEGIARNPASSGKIMTTMLIGLAMIESLAIYVLVIALILLFANPMLQYVVG